MTNDCLKTRNSFFLYTSYAGHWIDICSLLNYIHDVDEYTHIWFFKLFIDADRRG
jgi:hypothetical protein